MSENANEHQSLSSASDNKINVGESCSTSINKHTAEVCERKKVCRSIFGSNISSDSASGTDEPTMSTISCLKNETSKETDTVNDAANTDHSTRVESEGISYTGDGTVDDMLCMSQASEQHSMLDSGHSAHDDPCQAQRLYTGPYGRLLSPFKKYSSFHSFPCAKRNPRKLPGPAAKRTKLFHDYRLSSGSEESPIQKKALDLKSMEIDGSGEDSSDEDKWEIVEEESESEMDKQLDDKSSKFSLSTINVKSIIHKIITNESVVQMVRKAVEEEMVEHELKYEPKMTRSMLKQFEAQGHVPTNWGLSPRKKRDSPNFLEMELPEDEEDDEDFNPDKVVLESDEDSESVMSSCLSDLGSPLPPTLTVMPTESAVTPSAADDDLTITTDDNSSQSMLSPMGPPMQTSVPRSHHKASELGKRYQDALERDVQRCEQEAEELIAGRTRSKYPMTDCSILDIEANFVAPDITQDMYDTMCDDGDWTEFLTQFSLQQAETTTNDEIDTTHDEDTEDDPEYNYQQEIETYEVDKEDFRDDRAVKVSKKEVNELLDDILNNEEYETEPLDEQYKLTIKTQSEKIVFNSNTKKQTEYQHTLMAEIGEYEHRQINDQLRKHVQQLAQTVIMAQNGIDEHRAVAETATFYLTELSMFAGKMEELYGRSTYRVTNLGPALHLLDDEAMGDTEVLSQHDNHKLASLTFRYDCQCLPAFTYKQMKTMWMSDVFLFPELLPHGGFFKHIDIKRDRARVKFLDPEDNLLAMGVAQFNHLKNDAKDYIQRFMLPCKTRKQIEIRIKNLNAKAAKDNAVKFFKTYKRLPQFPRHAPEFDMTMMKSLKESCYGWHELPEWCQYFSSDDVSSLNEPVRDQWERRKELKRLRKARQSASFCLLETDICAVYPPEQPSISAPQQHTDSSFSASSGSNCESARNRPSAKRKRQKRQSRKKLNMHKQPKMDLFGSFLPLTLTGSAASQNNPLTICVMDNMQVSPISASLSTCISSLQVPTSLSPCNDAVQASAIQGSASTTSANPTIIIINENAPLQVQSFSQTVTFTPDSMFPQTVPPCITSQVSQTVPPCITSQVSQTVPPCITSQVSQTVPLETSSMKCDMSDMEGTSLTFEDICRPIMESEMSAGNMMLENGKELCGLYTESGSMLKLNSVNNNAIVNVVDVVTCKSDAVSDMSLCCSQDVNTMTLREGGSGQEVDIAHQAAEFVTKPSSVIEVQSSEISSTVLKYQSETEVDGLNGMQVVVYQDTATSPIPISSSADEVNLQKEAVGIIEPSSEEQERDSTLIDSLTEQCRYIPTIGAISQTDESCEMAPTPKHKQLPADMSGSEKTPKSSLEIMASLAPYFISPIHDAATLQQMALERTPTKIQLPTIAPKSIPPSQRIAPVSFSDLSPARRRMKPRLKTSPRKKQLQQQVKTILPKGFVISSFDTSPAKKAASGLVDRAKQLANQSKTFCKILPRPPNFQPKMNQEKLISKKCRRSGRRNVQYHKGINSNSQNSRIDTCNEDLCDSNQNAAVDDDDDDDYYDDDYDNDDADDDDEDDDRCGDTESDYTQSEDENETQVNIASL